MWETIKNEWDGIWWKRLSSFTMAVWLRRPDEGCVNRLKVQPLHRRKAKGEEIVGFYMKI